MPTKSVFNKFIKDMSAADLAAYCASCGVSEKYVVVHLKYGSKVPRRDLMVRLVAHSGGAVTRDDLMAHFYPESDFAGAA
ncbi:MAG: hypothetical protein OIF55_19215 [Amphritea sp.]|nr:hypothetical protein [Amphritea sp.]